MTVRLGIDTGGTFTDFVLVDEASGEIRTAKVPSTPDDPGGAVEHGLAQLADSLRVEQVIVGTTIATNTVIQRAGRKVVYVTNCGFEDVPFIGRLDKEHLYDLHGKKPKPLVLRRDCLGVPGRVDHHGRILEELDEKALVELAERLRDYAGEKVVVAICLLFSYLRPEHEQAVLRVARAALPGAAVSASHEVAPVWREYERASTTAADAYVKPAIETYVTRVGAVLRERLGLKRWNVLASNGGYLSAEEARRRPAQLLLSGLAGGVIGGRFFSQAVDFSSVFTLDMGGTSCDLGLVLDGSQQYASEFNVAWGIPVTIPCVAVKTISAGGGSIAWIDKGGLLHVGPRSAGAQPGPVAYGLGGTAPTLTDVNLTLGRLDPNYFLGGRMSLDAEAAKEALARLGERLGLSVEGAGLAAVRTADENMANTIRLIAVERGLDARDFALAAFGGAGPLHARAVAERLGIRTVLVPTAPGLCSAFGCAITEARLDRAQTAFMRSDRPDVERVAAMERALREEVLADLRRSVDAPEPLVRRSADMRYAGQNYELEVSLPDGDLDGGRWLELLQRFETEHERKYGFTLHGEPVELINLHVTAVRPEAAVSLAAPPARGAPEPVDIRPVWFDSEEAVDCPIYRRPTLPHGHEVVGPAVIEEADSTTLLAAGDRLLVDPTGVMIIELGHAS